MAKTYSFGPSPDWWTESHFEVLCPSPLLAIGERKPVAVFFGIPVFESRSLPNGEVQLWPYKWSAELEHPKEPRRG